MTRHNHVTIGRAWPEGRPARLRAAYPDAVEVPDAVASDIVHLQVGQIFFSYRGAPVITAVTVTTAATPPYELCG